jgi:acetylornithine deacetylase/succinyl-diaminopimelate desuccinylase-like protein
MAVRALMAHGGCPVGVKILIEGEEEIGSPNLAATVMEHAAELNCDLALTADGPLHDDGRPLIIFGVRGLLILELRARGALHDVHSGNRGGWAPMPAWDLVEALSSLRDAERKVSIPGFYDNVRQPTAAEQELMESLPFDLEGARAALGVTRLPDAAEGAPWQTLMFEPTLNIPGFASGYTGTGIKTIVPNEAIARIEMRLVADQDPDEIEESVRDHLRRFDLEIDRLAAVPPSMTPLDCPHVEDLLPALRAASGHEPLLRPRLGGTTPDHVFTRILGVPSLLVPYGSADMHHHAPNERIRVDDLYRGVRTTAAICVQLAHTSH